VDNCAVRERVLRRNGTSGKTVFSVPYRVQERQERRDEGRQTKICCRVRKERLSQVQISPKAAAFKAQKNVAVSHEKKEWDVLQEEANDSGRHRDQRKEGGKCFGSLLKKEGEGTHADKTHGPSSQMRKVLVRAWRETQRAETMLVLGGSINRRKKMG